MKILVTGGAGYIGSHTTVELQNAGYDVVILDNLYNSSERVVDRIEKITGKRPAFYNADLHDEAAVSDVFRREKIDAVIHFAAYKSAPDSVGKPLEYYYNNIGSLLSVLRAMKEHGVGRIVYSSSACVYGAITEMPLRETVQIGAINPYGETKIIGEKILRDICKADPGWSAVSLRYFNPVGAHPSGLIGDVPRGIPQNIAPYILQVATGKLDHLRITGDDFPTPDGTGIRDYIHIVDLAKGHVAAIKWALGNTGELVVNLGTGRGVSVYELFHAFERAVGRALPYKIYPRRPGDAAESYADVTRAREILGWRAELTVDDMCTDAWRWQSGNPNGYES